MICGRSVPERRARRLLSVYPRAWRTRYGVEFTELLLADLQDRPQSWRRTLDVVRGGILVRLQSAGLAASWVDPAERMRTSLAAVVCSLAAVTTFGVAMWSQVIIGWRWEPPSTVAVSVAMALMSVGALLMALLAVLAAAPLGWALLVAIARREVSRLLGPVALSAAGATVLVAGGLHFDHHWPGIGGHPWGYHGLVPSGLAAFCWAATRGITAYWAHPAALARFSGSEIGWMAGSLLAISCLVVGLAKTVRRLRLSTRCWVFEAVLARAAVAALAVFAAGAATWVGADAAPGPTGIYRVGAIDVVGICVMAGALVAAGQAARQARSAAARLTEVV